MLSDSPQTRGERYRLQIRVSECSGTDLDGTRREGHRGIGGFKEGVLGDEVLTIVALAVGVAVKIGIGHDLGSRHIESGDLDLGERTQVADINLALDLQFVVSQRYTFEF